MFFFVNWQDVNSGVGAELLNIVIVQKSLHSRAGPQPEVFTRAPMPSKVPK